MEAKPLEQVTFDVDSLIQDHPPRWNDRNKRLVYEIACSSGFPFQGQMTYARWPEEEPPAEISTRQQFSVSAGVFEYSAPAESAMIAWHLNFADPRLFVAYGSSLLAQDELQVAEHPILGSVRESLNSTGKPPRTLDEHGRPTPITVTGVQRRCAIDTLSNPAAGRPSGLYGNAFARASAEQVTSATKPLSPPTISNILAVAAPPGGYGEYSHEQITYILNAAYTGFSAARRESERLVPAGSHTIIHTGFWGCGAFGGNRTLMTVLQALAAGLAAVDIVFWAFDKHGADLAENARRQYNRLCDMTSSVSHLLDHLVQEKFPWGVSDGN
jgi:hypothetical protein